MNLFEGEKASLLGFQGAKARAIGGIGINGVETSYWIMAVLKCKKRDAGIGIPSGTRDYFEAGTSSATLGSSSLSMARRWARRAARSVSRSPLEAK